MSKHTGHLIILFIAPLMICPTFGATTPTPQATTDTPWNNIQTPWVYDSLVIPPDSNKALMFDHGVTLFKKKEFAGAATAFNDYLNNNSTADLAKAAVLNAAISSIRAKNFGDAIQSYQNYLTLFPKDVKEASVHIRIGDLHEEMGEYDESLKDFEAVPNAGDAYLEAIFHIGHDLEKLHRDQEAQEAFLKLVPLFPKDNGFRIAGLIEIANRMEHEPGKESQLREIYQDLIDHSPNPGIRDRYQKKLAQLH